MKVNNYIMCVCVHIFPTFFHTSLHIEYVYIFHIYIIRIQSQPRGGKGQTGAEGLLSLLKIPPTARSG